MKTVLAFGDSLTWGSNPQTGGRHPSSHRWPDTLGSRLGDGARIVADGLRGRTTAYDEHLADCDRNGVRLLPTSLYTHAPVDLVIVMLGVNDLKPHIAGTALAAMQGMRRLVQIAKTHQQGLTDGRTAQVLVVAPPPLVATDNVELAAMFAGGIAQSVQLAGLFEAIAADYGCRFFDAASVASASPIDGVHLDAENTQAIGHALAPLVADQLGLQTAN